MSGKSVMGLGRHGVVLILLCLYISMHLSVTWAKAPMESTAAFRISAQPLPTALLTYSEQSGIQVTSPAHLVEQKTSSGIEGRLDVRRALSQLLEGTGLNFEVIDTSSVIIVPMRTALDPGADEKRALHAENAAASENNEVIVTGTNIRGTQTIASQVQSYQREALEDAGSTSIQEFVRTLPQVFTGGRSEASGAILSARNGGMDNLSSASGINLRGLGNEASLVLLNGRRIASGALGSFYDISAIPLSAIARIDVLPDGASAIYGSDAIGGVVNIILREKLDGLETSARYGGVTSGNLRDFTANQLTGKSWDQGSILFNVDYAERSPLLASDRRFAHGLSGGTSYLLPKEQRLGSLLRIEQKLRDSLDISIDAYANNRDTEVEQFVRLQKVQVSADADTSQVGGTAEVSWRPFGDWEVALAHTSSRSDSQRLNKMRGFPAGDINTIVRAELGLSTTELKAYGSPFRAPGGASEIAFGAERRRESMDMTRINLPGPTSAINRTVDAVYGEIRLPLLSNHEPDRKTQSLELTAALRYEEYSDVESTDNWKFGVTWSPIPHLDLYAAWGTSFRAPYLYQYDATFASGLLFEAPNPSSPTGSTLVAAISNTPHPELGPETAETWTAGFSIAPDILPAVRIAGSYFNIDYRNRINTPLLTLTPFSDPLEISLIKIPGDPTILAQLQTAPNFGNISSRSLSDAEATLDGRAANQSRAKVSGFDLFIEGTARTDIGILAASLNASYFLSFDTQTIDSAPVIDIRSTIFNPVSLRARGNLQWSRGGWRTSASLNYTDDYVDNQQPEVRKVSSWATLDLSCAYTFDTTTQWMRRLTLRAVALNAFDRAPPRVADRGASYGDPGYDSQNANPMGRFISLQVSKNW